MSKSSAQRVFLVNPPCHTADSRWVLPVGLGYIASALETAGIRYEVLDMNGGHGYRELRKRVAGFKPDLIGVSLLSYRHREAAALLSRLKSDFPEAPIAAGNAHISVFREKALESIPAIDFGIAGEGESAIVELCSGVPVGGIKGLIYRRDDIPVFAGERSWEKNLDAIPFPRYGGFELERCVNRDVSGLPIYSSRGCPCRCTFCGTGTHARRYQARSAGHVLEELAYWYGRGYRRFNIIDDNFTLLKERAHSLCDLILSSRMRDMRLSCDNGIRADAADRELLAHMRRAGFFRLAFGVESGADVVLRSLKKGETAAMIDRAIADAVALEYEVTLFFLIGSPGEGWPEIESSFALALKHPVQMVRFANLLPIPGSELFQWVARHGRFLREPMDYINDMPSEIEDPVFEVPGFPAEQRRQAMRRARSITHRMRRDRALRRAAHLGWAGDILARIYSGSLIQDILMRHRAFSRLAHAVADRFLAQKTPTSP